MNPLPITGYGPRHRLLFDGDEAKYELWEVKFLGYMRLHKLYDVITPGNDMPDEAKNADAFAELVQCLDDRSLSLVIRDATNDGRKALLILQEHYIGKGKPRIISLYTKLTSLKMESGGCLTDYVIQAETAASSLNTAGEVISDSLLTAMVLKGLPAEYKTFTTVVTQKEQKMTFTEFKVILRSFEENEKCQRTTTENDDRVMRVQPSSHKSYGANPVMKCYTCGKPGHKSFECRSAKPKGKRDKRWCDNCKSHTHNTSYCRRNDSARTVADSGGEKSDVDESQSHSFVFKVSYDPVVTCNAMKTSLLVDCGATTHIVNDRAKFVKFDDAFDPTKHVIELADGSRTNGIVMGKGNAQVLIHDVEGCQREVMLENALFIPSYKQDIFSVQAASCKGASVTFTPNTAVLKASNGTIFVIEKQGKLYFLNNTIVGDCKTHTLEEWHMIMGHCNVDDVCKLESVVKGMKITNKCEFRCDTCVQGKMCQHRSSVPDERATSPLQFVHCDLAGPIDPVAKDGFRYALSFVDDYSGITMVYFLKQKCDTTEATVRFLADTAPFGAVKRIRSDNGTVFMCKEFKSLLIKNHIKHETSAPYSPHQNGTVERGWRSLFEMARCILLEGQLAKELWAYAVMASAYIRNRCYNHRTGNTPYEAMTGHKPDLSKMHIFGTTCYAYVQNKKKLDARSEKGVFVGYDKSSPAYLVFFPDSNVVKRVRCVKFTDEFDDVVEMSDPMSDAKPQVPDTVVENEHENERNDNEGVDRRYPKRIHVRPKYLDDYETEPDVDLANSTQCNIDYCYRVENVPRSFSEANSSFEAGKWHNAMNDEITALRDNETYEITPLPEGKTVVGGRWVYAVKLGPNGEEKYKARFVAKGYSQIPDIDYHETFSPTARLTSVRMLMQLAVQGDLVVHQMDVKTAYLNAPIDCEIYVEQPEGFEQEGENDEKLVCKLHKSLYGLKQSGRNWNNMLHEYLSNEQFEQSQVDACVYTKNTNESKVAIIVWVDDIIIAASNAQLLNDVKSSLSREFKMKDLGELSWFLGIEFKCVDDCIEMSPKKYADKVLTRFGMADCKPKPTPCEIGVNKIRFDDSTELANSKN